MERDYYLKKLLNVGLIEPIGIVDSTKSIISLDEVRFTNDVFEENFSIKQLTECFINKYCHKFAAKIILIKVLMKASESRMRRIFYSELGLISMTNANIYKVLSDECLEAIMEQNDYRNVKKKKNKALQIAIRKKNLNIERFLNSIINVVNEVPASVEK